MPPRPPVPLASAPQGQQRPSASPVRLRWGLPLPWAPYPSRLGPCCAVVGVRRGSLEGHSSQGTGWWGPSCAERGRRPASAPALAAQPLVSAVSHPAVAAGGSAASPGQERKAGLQCPAPCLPQPPPPPKLPIESPRLESIWMWNRISGSPGSSLNGLSTAVTRGACPI